MMNNRIASCLMLGGASLAIFALSTIHFAASMVVFGCLMAWVGWRLLRP